MVTPKSVGLIPVGFDNGNGYTKIAIKGVSVKHPSVLLDTTYHNTEHFRNTMPSYGAHIQYLDGTQESLIGRSWLSGYEALIQDPVAQTRVVDEADGKIKHGLKLLLAGLSTMDLPQEVNIACVCSIPDADNFGLALSESLSGTHVIKVNGNANMTVHISSKAVEEGVGTIQHIIGTGHAKLTDRVGILDIGNGTIISSVYFDGLSIPESRNVLPSGVDDLIRAICKSSDIVKRLSQEGKKQHIVKGIEDQTFLYGRTNWSFADTYSSELKKWVISRLAIAMKNVYPWLGDCSGFFAVGGGSQLPQIGEALKAKGLTVLADPQMANVNGLLKMAQRLK